ncbi:hypothetical protein VCHA53O466_50048 [Vibrio chagasii]|nr:hypothetical protein VCHA53O466_50048 [Vibrio chagasii]
MRKVYLSARGWCHGYEGEDSYTFVGRSGITRSISKLEPKGTLGVIGKLMRGAGAMRSNVVSEWKLFCEQNSDEPEWSIHTNQLNQFYHDELKVGDSVLAKCHNEYAKCTIEGFYVECGLPRVLVTIDVDDETQNEHPLIRTQDKRLAIILLSAIKNPNTGLHYSYCSGREIKIPEIE